MTKNVTLKISNPHSCRQYIRVLGNTIKGLPGIISVAMKKGSTQVEVAVSYESGKINFERIRDAVTELGYPVSGPS